VTRYSLERTIEGHPPQVLGRGMSAAYALSIAADLLSSDATMSVTIRALDTPAVLRSHQPAPRTRMVEE
jgi:hypothetical protein